MCVETVLDCLNGAVVEVILTLVLLCGSVHASEPRLVKKITRTINREGGRNDLVYPGYLVVSWYRGKSTKEEFLVDCSTRYLCRINRDSCFFDPEWLPWAPGSLGDKILLKVCGPN